MDRDTAIKIACSSGFAKRLISNLTGWDEKKTFAENATTLKMNPLTARQLAFRYNLKFMKAVKRGYINKDYSGLVKKWDGGKSIEQNAKALGISEGHARGLRCKLALSYTSKTKTGKLRHVSTPKQSDAVLKMRALRAAGATFKEIGAMFGVSKQRIAQLCE